MAQDLIPMNFIPLTSEEVRQRGWNELDVIFVTGDAYVDHPAFGVPLLARWLEKHGFRVGIIAQPDWRSKEPFMRLGRPRLCFAVSAGAMDSMVAHYTPARKLRHDDAYTPGNRHGARPNRATIVYTSRIKEAYRDVPVIIGGIEASLRRFAHYDYWEDKVRRSILADSKADFLIYGMAERPLLEVVTRLQAGEASAGIGSVPGVCRMAGALEATGFPCTHQSGRDAQHAASFLEIPSFEEVAADKARFAEAFRSVSREQNPYSSRTVVQRHGERLLIVSPPSLPLSEKEMDEVYALPFTKKVHPSYSEPIPAWEQIKASVTSHRGCFGGCAFCAIALHQGKAIQSRSEASIVSEVKGMIREKWFRGTVSDVGGPTANMYGLSCSSIEANRVCRRSSCIFPRICRHLDCSDRKSARLLRTVREIPGVRHLSVSSGVRYDLMGRQQDYFRELIRHHVGGLLKVAPEHLVDRVTALMRKPGKASFEAFVHCFYDESRQAGKRQGLVPYLISGHPGCTLADMLELAIMLKRMGFRVEQVQDFTPTPGSLATCMYHTGIDPEAGKKVYVPRSDREKKLQKALLLWHLPDERGNVVAALRELGREEVATELLGGGGRTKNVAESVSCRNRGRRGGRGDVSGLDDHNGR